MKMEKSGIFNILEKEYAQFTGSIFAVAVNSGTAALHLSLVALGIGPGDEVIVPDFTMAACGFAVQYTGARPVFVDCDDSLLIDVNQIRAAITPRTKAIMPVHIYGRLCNMKEIYRIAQENNLFVIEDACEAQGAVYDSKADVTCYSFFKNKIISAEEGGIVTTNRPGLYERMVYLKNMAFDENHTYFHTDIGFNYRIPETQAKMALRSLKKYKKNSKKRRVIEAWYDELIPEPLQMPKRDAVWVYDILLPPYRDEAIKRIQGARYFFKPLSIMPMWSGPVGPKALDYSQKGMYLPVHPSMIKADVQNICHELYQLL